MVIMPGRITQVPYRAHLRLGFAISAVREECELLSVEKENENARITTHDPMMGVTNWRLEEEELQVLCSINTNSTIYYIAELPYSTWQRCDILPWTVYVQYTFGLPSQHLSRH